MIKLNGITIFLIFDIFCLVFSLFTKTVFAKNPSVYGKVIVIDPGHGGKDNGAEVDSIIEDEINLNISKYLYEELFDRGAVVNITRTGDYDLATNDAKNRKNQDLKRRTQFINEVDADIFISIHLNIYETNNVSGVQVFYQEYKEESTSLANLIQKQFNKNINKKNKKAKIGDFYILNYTYPIGVLVECGFLSNTEERKNLSTADYQKKLAIYIYQGINEYFKS